MNKKMTDPYHILNGDALREHFPEAMNNNLIVARECLVDGEVEGNTLEEIYLTRATFLSQNYGGTIKDYYDKTVPEFQKIIDLDDDVVVNLWFEDDLFCQVNFWFVVHLFVHHKKDNRLYLVRPKEHSSYGFGGLNADELMSIYRDRILIANKQDLAALWLAYQNKDNDTLLKLARDLSSQYPFILPAVEAHMDRKATAGKRGRPEQSLIDIMNELNTKDFRTVFKAFNERENIYGFGDILVRRIFDKIEQSKAT